MARKCIGPLRLRSLSYGLGEVMAKRRQDRATLVYTPTAADVAVLRTCAAREATPPIAEGGVLLEPGSRYNTQRKGASSSINIALVSDDPKWIDTDLADYGTWKQFRAGVPLAPAGRAIIDFYIRARGDAERELRGNVTAYVEGGVLTRVDGCSRQLWSAG